MNGQKPLPLVSVCIPTFNCEGFIQRTIASVLGSTYENIEILITDDCSTDKTSEIISQFKDKRIRFSRNEKRLGVPGNWNQAITKSQGELICFLNHDDLISPFWIEYAERILRKNPGVDWVVSAFHIVDSENAPLAFIQRFSENRAYDPIESFPEIIKLNGLGAGIILRKRILQQSGLFDESIGPSADNELYGRLSTRFTMFFSTAPHTSWRLHPDNLTHKWNNAEQTKEGFRILKRIFSDPGIPSELLRYKHTAYLYFIVRSIKAVNELFKQGDNEMARGILARVEKEILQLSEINFL